MRARNTFALQEIFGEAVIAGWNALENRTRPLIGPATVYAGPHRISLWSDAARERDFDKPGITGRDALKDGARFLIEAATTRRFGRG